MNLLNIVGASHGGKPTERVDAPNMLGQPANVVPWWQPYWGRVLFLVAPFIVNS